MSRRRWFLWWVCWGWLGVAACAWAADPAVVIVSSEQSPAYAELADALSAELERAGVPGSELRRLSVEQFAGATMGTPKLVVALGVRAAGLAAQSQERVPVLCTLLPRASFERVASEAARKPSGQFSAIYLDQPLSRQLELVRLILPQARRIGVLWGEASFGQQAALEAAATSRGLRVVSARLGAAPSLFSALKSVLDEADVLLALADPQVYHSASVQNILLSSVRQRVPVFAFSPAYVKAGALAAVYVTPTQLGVQAAALARAVLQGRALPATPQYSREFEVSVNLPVAHALELELDAAALTARLRALERAP